MIVCDALSRSSITLVKVLLLPYMPASTARICFEFAHVAFGEFGCCVTFARPQRFEDGAVSAIRSGSDRFSSTRASSSSSTVFASSVFGAGGADGQPRSVSSLASESRGRGRSTTQCLCRNHLGAECRKWRTCLSRRTPLRFASTCESQFPSSSSVIGPSAAALAEAVSGLGWRPKLRGCSSRGLTGTRRTSGFPCLATPISSPLRARCNRLAKCVFAS